MSLHLSLQLESHSFGIDGLLGYRQLDATVVIEWRLVNVGQTNVKGGDDGLLNVFAKPAIVQHVQNFNPQSVEVVVHRNEETLLKVELAVQDLSRVEHVGVAAKPHEYVVVKGEVSEGVYLDKDLAKGMPVRLIDIEGLLRSARGDGAFVVWLD